MAYSTTFKTREGCNDRIFSDLRAGIELSGGQVTTLYGAQLAYSDVNDLGVGVVGNYYNSGELVSLERDGRFNVKCAEALGAGKPVSPGANGTVEEFTATRRADGAHKIGFMIEAGTSGLYAQMEIQTA